MRICKKCGTSDEVVDFVPLTNCCKPCKAIYMKSYNKKNKDELARKRVAYSKAYHKKNKERLIPIRKAWKRKNKHKGALYAARRRAAQRKATPPWFLEDDIAPEYAMAAFLSSATFGQGYHVDHIVPLISKFVCGLHVKENIRVIRAEENMRKGNYYWPDMW